MIGIGRLTMIRAAAAKTGGRMAVVPNPGQYAKLRAAQLETSGDTSEALYRELALQAFVAVVFRVPFAFGDECARLTACRADRLLRPHFTVLQSKIKYLVIFPHKIA